MLKLKKDGTLLNGVKFNEGVFCFRGEPEDSPIINNLRYWSKTPVLSSLNQTLFFINLYFCAGLGGGDYERRTINE